MVTKSHILDEIKRTTAKNGGTPLGTHRFFTETRIKETDWRGKYWTHWGQALEEAGFQPNRMSTAYADEFLLEKFAALVREIGCFPVKAALQMKAYNDKNFPSCKAFSRLGRKGELAAKVVKYCEEHGEYEDVIKICSPHCVQADVEVSVDDLVQATEDGDVYLLKSGRFYKIGRSNAVGRRAQELKLQLPEKISLVHTIKTDDPPGIEFYWHRRFQSKRKNGEWFDLTAEDVRAFKRRKFM